MSTPTKMRGAIQPSRLRPRTAGAHRASTLHEPPGHVPIPRRWRTERARGQHPPGHRRQGAWAMPSTPVRSAERTRPTHEKKGNGGPPSAGGRGPAPHLHAGMQMIRSSGPARCSRLDPLTARSPTGRWGKPAGRRSYSAWCDPDHCATFPSGLHSLADERLDQWTESAHGVASRRGVAPVLSTGTAGLGLAVVAWWALIVGVVASAVPNEVVPARTLSPAIVEGSVAMIHAPPLEAWPIPTDGHVRRLSPGLPRRR